MRRWRRREFELEQLPRAEILKQRVASEFDLISLARDGGGDVVLTVAQSRATLRADAQLVVWRCVIGDVDLESATAVSVNASRQTVDVFLHEACGLVSEQDVIRRIVQFDGGAEEQERERRREHGEQCGERLLAARFFTRPTRRRCRGRVRDQAGTPKPET